MEESSEPHMETDVSSTTDDVPETQEVTGSDGNVEMIVIVEKLDDEPSADEEAVEQPSPNYELINKAMTPEDESREIETQVPKSSAKSPVKSPEKSPAKSPAKPLVKLPVKSPIKSPPNSPAKSLVKSPTKSSNTEVADVQSEPEEEHMVVIVQQQDEVSPAAETQQIEAADSSMEPVAIQSEDKPTQIQKTLKKEAQKPVQKSPLKDLQPSESTVTKDSKQGLIDIVLVNGTIQSNDTSKKDDMSTKTIVNTFPIDITNETSNDSHPETLSDVSEKEHKSISRELKSLINSAKESKIISECTQLTSKTRKSRTLDTSNSNLNSSLGEANKIHNTRRISDMSQKSNCSEKSEGVVLKRSMRSQNPEFVSKVKQFLNSVTGRTNKDSGDEDEEGEKTELLEPITRPTPPKRRKSDAAVTEKSNKLRSDSYCWRCHWVVEENELHPAMQCTVCPRSFHYKCLTGSERNKINLEKNWVCPECMIVLQAESSESRSPAMKKISLGMLCDLLKHALERMMDLNGVEPFMQPVDRAAFPDYDKYVVHPMDLSLMKDNINEGLYGSPEAFIADAQWILHNSIIFNTFTHDIGSAVQSKLTAAARALVRSCRAEMGEIEACPECYAAAHARRPTWFTDVCTTPHILFWAKLKGFPYWPAKGMSVNSSGLVDVRFFGAHDRAWVPAKDCFLYCEKDPNNFRTKRQDIIDSMQEAEHHIRNISRKYGRFVYPPFKTQFEPSKMYEQLKMMIPTFEGEVRPLVKKSPASKPKSRTNSYKGYKESFNDGDASDNEDTTKARKMADGAEIIKMEEDDSITMDKSIVNPEKDMETETPVIKTKEDSQPSTLTSSTRKRRRSAAVLEEAVVTIIESSGSSCSSSSTSEKRTKLQDSEEDKKPEENEPTSSKPDENPTTDISADVTSEAIPSQTNVTPPKAKDSDPRSNVEKDKQRVTPIRIALVTKERRKTRNSSTSKDTTGKIITPIKDKEKEKPLPVRRKSTRSEKGDKMTPSTKYEKVENSTPKAEKTPAAKPENVEKPSKSEKPSNSKSDKDEKTPNSKVEKTPNTKVEKPPNSKVDKVEKTPSDKSTKEDRSRVVKRSNSRSSRSTNSTSSTRSSERTEKKSEKTSENSKTKRRASSSSAKEKDKDSDTDKSVMGKQVSPKLTPEILSPKSVKDRLQFDDDTTLAVLARETSKSTVSSSSTGLPTISCVRSLSTISQNTGVTITKTTTNANTIDITEETTLESSIFTPTSTDTVTTMQDAVSKLQRLRNDPEPVVGRVGVCSFARMTSPERENTNNEVQVEIKAEPIDLDDADRHMEKMDLMNAFRLRPVTPQVMPNPPKNLRDVRINKVVVTPLNARKVAPATATATKVPEVRPRAKKTFPQPKKPEEGRSELNSKNSMVYIPIQPPMTQAPVRLPRPQINLPTVTSVLRPPIVSVANNLVNTVTTPLMQPSSSPTSTSATVTTSTSVATVPTVHTVPLMTSVNGQWMFSFQPVMSVGALDSAVSPPMVNGIAERGNPAAAVPALSANLAPVIPVVSTPAPAILNNRTTENTPGEPPRLQPRPLLHPLDGSTPVGGVPAASTAGPVTAKLNQNAVKLTDFFRTLLEDSIEKLDEPWSQLTTLRLQLEQETWRHQQEIKELKHNHELTLAEMRSLFDKEKLRAVSEARRAAHAELDATVKVVKSKQWCANCRQEAQFHCCWNTSYCDLACQRAHWSQHYATCQQRDKNDNNGEPPMSPESRLQPQPDTMPKNTSSPTITVGGKVAPSRPFNTDPHSSQKTSIIVSMVEDTSGNQTMKCVGTYKPPTPTQMQPIIINKQLMNNEETANANKKVMSSSGGYLIVGAPNNSTVVTPARRTHTIQYYT